jgi:dihydrofolate reductase
VSVDGFVAGPDPDLGDPLGRGGEQLHEWILGLASWRDPHGRQGGEQGTADDDVVREGMARTGAVIMGRRMYSGGSGPWEQDPKADGWWGEDPPFRTEVFVLTHHARDRKPMPRGNGFTFVTDGIEAALEQARAAAGDDDVFIAGGADVARQFLAAGLVDDMVIHLAPVLLGDGTRLLDGVGDLQLELVEAVDAPLVTHLHYRTVR